MGEIRPDLLSKDHPILMIMCAARCFMGADEFEFLAVFFSVVATAKSHENRRCAHKKETRRVDEFRFRKCFHI